MNLSSRWCVVAALALGAVGCSDPVPPASQGAFIAYVNSVSPQPAGKSCPSGAALTFDVPALNDTKPTEILTQSQYKEHVVDGAGDDSQHKSVATVTCTVKGKSTFTFAGHVAASSRSLEVSDGSVGADFKGVASISLRDNGQPGFSNTLSSPTPNCAIEVMNINGVPQIKAGSMWASFDCPSVEAAPSDYCRAHGYFVLENCAQ